LFAGGPTFTRCEQYGWKYLITLQDGDLPSLHQDFAGVMKFAPENQLRFTPSGYPPTPQVYRGRDDLRYLDTEQRRHTLSVIECLETSTVKGQPPTPRFKGVSNFNVTAKNVIPLANQDVL